MAIKITQKKYQNKKKDFIKMSLFALIYLIILAMLLSFNKERDTSFKGLIKEGNDYIKQGKTALALECFKNIVSKYPNNPYVHLKLGELYKQNNNNDMAKIEYFQAMELAPNSIDAHVDMANLYFANGDYDLAEKVINNLKETNFKTRIIKGKFYLKLATISPNTQDKILVLRKAYRYLQNTNDPSFEKTKNLLAQNFINLANQYINNGDNANAIITLKIALKYTEMPEIYNGLASLYIEKDNKKALYFIKKSMNLSNKQKNLDKCYELLMATGKSFLDQKNTYYAKYIFQTAKNLDPTKTIPYYNEQPILVNIISTQFNENNNENKFLPGISFKITNVTKNDINYLNSKVVFLKGNNVFSETTQQLADSNAPIASDSVTSAINVFSTKTVDEFVNLDSYSVKIFLSTKTPDEWLLYRYVPISKEN